MRVGYGGCLPDDQIVDGVRPVGPDRNHPRNHAKRNGYDYSYSEYCCIQSKMRGPEPCSSYPVPHGCLWSDLQLGFLEHLDDLCGLPRQKRVDLVVSEKLSVICWWHKSFFDCSR